MIRAKKYKGEKYSSVHIHETLLYDFCNNRFEKDVFKHFRENKQLLIEEINDNAKQKK
jgi:hypothetical protein